MDASERDAPPPAPVCARCARAPRNPDDRATWVTIDGGRLCPGCLTLHDRERLRAEEDR